MDIVTTTEVNKNSYALYQMVTFLTTLSHPIFYKLRHLSSFMSS